MSAQILLLLDLDQCVPLSLLTRLENKDSDAAPGSGPDSIRRRLRRQCARLRRACLRLLVSRLRPRDDFRHFHQVPKFAYRFYSSSGFFSVESSSQAACHFQELGEDTVQGFVEELWNKLERLVGEGDDQDEDRGKSDRIFDGRDFQRHLDSRAAKAGADTLKRALEDIALLYEWDSPDLNSPVKRRGREKHHSPDSAIFVFTRLPRNKQDLQDFFLKRGQSAKFNKARDVSHALMDKNSRELLISRGAADTSKVGLSIVDTGCNFELKTKDDDAILQAFSKFLLGVRGNVIPLQEIVKDDEQFNSLVTSWFVPCQETFFLGSSTLNEPPEETLPKNNLLKILQRQCMPPKKTNAMQLKRKLSRDSCGEDEGVRERKIPRRKSNESSSSRRSSSEGGTRAQRLVRLSSTTLETRRQTSVAGATDAPAPGIGDGDPEEKARFLAKFNSRMDHFGPGKTVDAIGQLQAEAIRNSTSDLHLAYLAELTVRRLLEESSTANCGGPESRWDKVERMLEEHFLVEPQVVLGRKSSQDGKIRDLKLQVLFRIEINWLVSQRSRQEALQASMLQFLRQISFNSPKDPGAMQSFLSNTLAPLYCNPQPELLCYLFDELSVPRCSQLLKFFSPVKSVAPPKTNNCLSQPATVELVEQSILDRAAETHQDKLEKLKKRMQGQSLQIHVKSKKDKGKNSGAITASRIKMARIPRKKERGSTSKKRNRTKRASTSVPAKSDPVAVRGAKRNLNFDTLAKSEDGGKRRASPRKRVAITTLVTPKKMTPNKTHRIMVPETPTGKRDSCNDRTVRRKTDGTTTITESPDGKGLMSGDGEGVIPQTPRTLRARDALRKKSFYSAEEGEAARSILRSEENLRMQGEEAAGLQANPMADKRESAGQVLFQHLLRKGDKRDNLAKLRSTTPVKAVADVKNSPTLSTPLKNNTPVITPKKNVYFSPGRIVAFDLNKQPPAPPSSGKKRGKGILKESNSNLSSLLQSPPVTRQSPRSSTGGTEATRARMSLFTSPTKPIPRFGNSPKLVLVDVSRRRSRSSTSSKRESLELKETKETSGKSEKDSPIKKPDNKSPVSRKSNKKPKETEDGSKDNEGTKVLATPTKCTPEQKSTTLDGGSDSKLATPTNSRPSRVKSTPNRFGIDDLRLEDVVSTPPPSKRPILHDKVDTPKSSGKKLRSKTSRAKRERISGGKKCIQVSVSHVTDSQVENIIADVRRSPRKLPEGVSRATGDSPATTSGDEENLTNYAHTWQVADHQLGEKLKLKLRRSPMPHRQLKPQQLRRIQASDQRLSRQAASEIGISPNRLRGLMFGSPSPAKRRTGGAHATSSSSTVGRTHAPLTPVGLYDLTTSPLVKEDKSDTKDLSNKKTRSSSRKRLSYV